MALPGALDWKNWVIQAHGPWHDLSVSLAIAAAFLAVRVVVFWTTAPILKRKLARLGPSFTNLQLPMSEDIWEVTVRAAGTRASAASASLTLPA